MSRCTAPVTGHHRDPTTRARCPSCTPAAASPSVRAKAAPGSQAGPRVIEYLAETIQRLLPSLEEDMGRTLSPGEIERLAEATGFDVHSSEFLQDIAMTQCKHIEATSGSRLVDLEGDLLAGVDLRALPQWLRDSWSISQAVSQEANDEAGQWNFVTLDVDGEGPGEGDEQDEWDSVALKPYATLREAIVAKTEVRGSNSAALDVLEEVGPDAIIDPVHVRMVLATHGNI